MKLRLAAAAAFGLAASVAATPSFANVGPVPTGVPRLQHIFVIMMENHGYAQIANNPNAPFINGYMKSSNLATNYFAVAHPSLTNYLEITGGSNFGVLSDGNPDWHNASCKPDIAAGTVDDEAAGLAVCPIAGSGTDAATPLIDTKNEVTPGQPGDIEIDGKLSFAADKHITGANISEQLANNGLSWKSYQESLPVTGADGVNSADGEYSNLTDFSKIKPVLKPALSSSNIVALYAAKHNPFVYFKAGQTAAALKKTVNFDQLYADLATGDVPNFAFIVPNQCNDQHGRGNGTAFCNFDPDDNGTQGGLNPALIQLGDQAVERLVTAIHNSPAWHDGRAAIVMVWDENDYFHTPETNKVVLTVDKNYGTHGKSSSTLYTHFSLLKSLEAGFILPCLNHACDSSVAVMSDLFAAK
jgi:hypothetical protein